MQTAAVMYMTNAVNMASCSPLTEHFPADAVPAVSGIFHVNSSYARRKAAAKSHMDSQVRGSPVGLKV